MDAGPCALGVPGELKVGLTWSSDGGTLDVHLRRDADAFCSASSCYWNTCVNQSPEWDGVLGRTNGDPRLDIDDIDNVGTENITVYRLPPGRYVVGVHWFDNSTVQSNDVVDAVVQVCHGRTGFRRQVQVLRLRALWEAAAIEVTDAGSTISMPERCVADVACNESVAGLPGDCTGLIGLPDAGVP